MSPMVRVTPGGGSGSGGNPTPITLTAVSAVITPNAAVGSLFRYTATADVTLASPTAGTDGQLITVEVFASGGARTLTIAGVTETATIPTGQWWSGTLRYHTTGDTWILNDGTGGGGTVDVTVGGAAGGVLSGTYPNPTFAADMATQAELDAARFALQTTIGTLTGRVSSLETGGTPAPTVPGTPVIGTVTAGNTQATVPFSPPTSDGGSVITSYTATSTPGGLTASGTASPLTVTGLTNGTSYTFKVKATNSVGTGPESAASNPVTPAAGGTPPSTTAPFGTAPFGSARFGG